jgi:hypothetical protein
VADYTEALERFPVSATLYANRAMALLKVGREGERVTHPAGSARILGGKRPDPSYSGQNSPQDWKICREENRVTNSGGTAGEGREGRVGEESGDDGEG